MTGRNGALARFRLISQLLGKEYVVEVLKSEHEKVIGKTQASDRQELDERFGESLESAVEVVS